MSGAATAKSRQLSPQPRLLRRRMLTLRAKICVVYIYDLTIGLTVRIIGVFEERQDGRYSAMRMVLLAVIGNKTTFMRMY